ncbi:MAG: Regulator of RpoS [Chroococcidiopsis cubana SAG 39.79]|uniref:Transcriptional regulator n=1 Tax=Chroococcidiopsis cubana SAG 39.79 TaxID=388085 RepID=A0AB37UBM2_9CYAN|nr:response regulator [Chroococcidiopsis cubana]MDZ4875022.1 Regulator of RpoS [Chroococcidiopsis cubana SAG 39.79]PSB64962.1 transcriptional regulator [Chroococcidiopsis cubana CCALA 043]RUT02940.1 transcriptional regulator [Chroococcidiopsis cubana SAG 39.79]
MRILVVEDDEFIANALDLVLSEQNYAVEIAADGESGWELVQAYEYDLILLDVMLPKLDGIELCRRVRSQGYKMPILLLTGRDSSHDKAIGLDAGADDYLVKPFDQEELFARVRALLRRGNTSVSPVLEWGELRLDPSSCEVTYSGRSLQLTPKEYALLELFLRNNRRVFSCSAILDRVWSFDKTPGEEAVRTQIKGLRQKLKAVGAPADAIETVYGIGYRLKSPSVNKLTIPSSEEPSEQTRQQTLTALAGVWERFQGRVNEQVMLLEQATTQILPAQLTTEQRHHAEQAAHTLAGSLGTFGFATGSQLARKIERSLRAKKPMSQTETKHLRELVAALRRSIELTPPELTTPVAVKQELPQLLIFNSDRHLAEPLIEEAGVWGIQAEIATHLESARKAIALSPPQVVLLDLDGNTADSLALLVELKHRYPSLPVLVHSDRDNLMTRLEVARCGGHAFLPKPVPPAQVLQAVTQLLPKEATAAKVMVVDDDPQILATLRSLLEPWGLRTICIEDPRRFWETLEASAPDLLILDINMPHLSGLELCQIVRQDSHWCGLPILFLTAYSDANTVNQVFAVGADDFVSKPIVGPELVNRIMNRLDRIELLRNLAEIDPLTGVANRHKSTQDLERLLNLAKRHHQPLCLAVLDIDRFKLVNDTCGHAVGDAVLRQLGQWLLHSLRREDIVARWGGEEFICGLYGMTSQDGVQRLTDISIGWQQQQSTHPQCNIPITFSAGIAHYPQHGADLETLYRVADKALYRAKKNGRGRVVASKETVTSDQLSVASD